MIYRNQIVREDGTIVILSAEGSYDCLTNDFNCNYWAKVLRKGQTEWEHYYPIRKGDSAMRETTVDEYLKSGWGSVVKPSEVIKITLELLEILNKR